MEVISWWDKIRSLQLLVVWSVFIDDQFSRYMSAAYTQVFSKTRFPYAHLTDDHTTQSAKWQISADVFEFYRKTGKLYSKEEVGSM